MSQSFHEKHEIQRDYLGLVKQASDYVQAFSERIQSWDDSIKEREATELALLVHSMGVKTIPVLDRPRQCFQTLIEKTEQQIRFFN